MAISWIDSVKSTGTLKIYNGIPSGKWATIFNASFEVFNNLNTQYGLGVRLDKSEDKDSADVVMQTSDGTAAFDYHDVRYSIAFDGKALKGKTRLVHPTGSIEKAYVFLPSQPLVNTPKGQRGLGVNAMKVIAVHELIHACGLTDSDHTDDDLFYGNPVPAIGDTANGDKIMLNNKTGNYVRFPPFVLSPATICKIRASW